MFFVGIEFWCTEEKIKINETMGVDDVGVSDNSIWIGIHIV